MMKDVEREINKLYKKVFETVFSKKGLLALSRRNRIAILERAEKLESSDAYEEFAKQFAKDTFRQDLKIAQKSGIVPSQKLSLLEKLFSIKRFNGRTIYTVLGQSVSVKYKKAPTFPENAIEVSENGVNAVKTELKHTRA